MVLGRRKSYGMQAGCDFRTQRMRHHDKPPWPETNGSVKYPSPVNIQETVQSRENASHPLLHAWAVHPSTRRDLIALCSLPRIAQQRICFHFLPRQKSLKSRSWAYGLAMARPPTSRAPGQAALLQTEAHLASQEHIFLTNAS